MSDLTKSWRPEGYEGVRGGGTLAVPLQVLSFGRGAEGYYCKL